jgi:hypothetical protein
MLFVKFNIKILLRLYDILKLCKCIKGILRLLLLYFECSAYIKLLLKV